MLVKCSNCKSRLRVTDENIRPDGSSIKCHKCSSIIFFSKTTTPKEATEKLGIQHKHSKLKYSSDIAKEITNKISGVSSKTPEPSSDKVEVNDTIKRWRMVAGIFFATVMLLLLIFMWTWGYPSSMVDFFPWSYYAFFPVLLLTIIAFIILNKKEQEAKRK